MRTKYRYIWATKDIRATSDKSLPIYECEDAYHGPKGPDDFSSLHDLKVEGEFIVQDVIWGVPYKRNEYLKENLNKL